MKKVIAELCQNHNGDSGLIAEMVSAASESGADILKMQYLRSSTLSHRPRFDHGLSDGGKVIHIKRPFKEEYDRLKLLDVPDSCHEKFLADCERFSVQPMVTVFTLEDVNRVFSIGYKNIKLASFDCASPVLIKAVVTHPNLSKLVISTGCTYRHEIQHAYSLASGVSDLAFLHCISIYPTPITEAHLARIGWLQSFCKTVGISDHSNPEKDGCHVAAAASYLGAELIEKHFTILPKDQTKDGPVSVNPTQLSSLTSIFKASTAEQLKYIEDYDLDLSIMLGDHNREMSCPEMLNRDYYQGRFCNTRQDGSRYFNWQIP